MSRSFSLSGCARKPSRAVALHKRNGQTERTGAGNNAKSALFIGAGAIVYYFGRSPGQVRARARSALVSPEVGSVGCCGARARTHTNTHLTLCKHNQTELGRSLFPADFCARRRRRQRRPQATRRRDWLGANEAPIDKAPLLGLICIRLLLRPLPRLAAPPSAAAAPPLRADKKEIARADRSLSAAAAAALVLFSDTLSGHLRLERANDYCGAATIGCARTYLRPLRLYLRQRPTDGRTREGSIDARARATGTAP